MILKRGVPKLIRIWIVSLHISKENVQDYATHAQVRLVHKPQVSKCETHSSHTRDFPQYFIPI